MRGQKRKSIFVHGLHGLYILSLAKRPQWSSSYIRKELDKGIQTPDIAEFA